MPEGVNIDREIKEIRQLLDGENEEKSGC